MSLPRHSTFGGDPAQLALQVGEFARDAIEALRARPAAQRVVVEQYTATGSTATRIRIGAAARPWAVLLARVALAYGEDQAVVCTPILNFVWDATTGSVDVFEPDGLVANTVYRLQFIVEEEE
jgi:hypothetical protein